MLFANLCCTIKSDVLRYIYALGFDLMRWVRVGGGASLTSFHFHKASASLKHPSYSCLTQRATVLCGALQYEFHRL